MIVKYFYYHVGSQVSKNTSGGDTIRLFDKIDSNGGILCVWRGGIGKYYLNSEKLGFNMD